MKVFTRVLLVALLSTTAHADDTTKSHDHPTKTTDTAKQDTAKPEKLTPAELQVLAHYHEVNLMEIDLGKAALKKAPTQAVKSYAEMLVDDHQASDKKLVALAKKTGQKIPKEKPPTQAERVEKAQAKKHALALKKLTGAAFEREYLRTMVADHDKELAKIDAKMAEVNHSELQDLLRAKKPVLQAHADQARELQKSNAQASAGGAATGGSSTQTPLAK